MTIRTMAAASATALCAAMPSGAAAQAASEAPGGAHAPADGLGDIVVTARRTQERLQDVPVAVTAFGTSELQRRNIVDVRSLANVAPGLSISEANAPTTLILTIRGLGNTNPNTGSDAAVGLYLNDVPINIQNGTNIGLFDLEGAQVLKGPQGTLFGRNTTGGALLLNARKPTDVFEGYAQAGGTFFRVGHGGQGEAVVNLPVTPHLALRAGVSVVDRDGYARNVAPRDTPDSAYGFVPLPYGRTDFKNELYLRSQSWRLSARWTPSDVFENVIIYDGGHIRSTGLPTHATALNPTGSSVVFAPFLGFPDPTAAYAALNADKQKYWWSTDTISNNPLFLNTENVSNTSTLKLADNVTLKNIFGYRHVRETYVQDITGLGAAYYVYRQRTGGFDLSDELQLQAHTSDNRLSWVAGLFYFKENRFNISDRTVAFGSPGGGTDYDSRSQSYSAFTQGTFKATDKISLTAGVRSTIDRRAATLSRTVPDATGTPVSCVFPGVALADCSLSGRKTFRAATYTLSADYKPDRATLVYLTSRRGYRSGGFSSTQTSTTGGLSVFKPETLTDYELGLKRDWRLGGDVQLRTNLAIYHQIYNDIQRLAVDPSDFTNQIILNASKAHVNGGEAEITLIPAHGISLTYAYARVVPKYYDFVVGGVDYSQNTFSYAPRNTHTVNTTLTVPMGEAMGTLTFSADYHHQSKYFYDDEIQTTRGGTFPTAVLGQKGYGTLGLNARWNGIMGSRADLELFATNVTNTHVLPNGSPSTYPTLGNGIGFYSLPPRMIGFNLRYNFGG